MPTPADTVALLDTLATDGRLAAACAGLGIDLLVLHGSAVDRPGTAADVDLAYRLTPETAADPWNAVHVADALGALTGSDALDLMPLHRADPVAAWAALGRGRPLVQAAVGDFAEASIAAFQQFRDTAKFRRLALDLVAS